VEELKVDVEENCVGVEDEMGLNSRKLEEMERRRM
jgi:hypothetical protein